MGNQQITVSVPKVYVDQLTSMTETHGKSISTMVAEALSRYLADEEGDR